jgi:sulfur relay (sulfurtransferase) complex TusBCD TusD component (DsrE family)
MLPFLFAASAVQVGGSVTWMLFHDTVLMAVDGVGKTLVTVGPPNRYEEIAGHANVTLWSCRPCVEARGLAAGSLDRRIKLGGMNDFQAAAKGPEAKVVGLLRAVRTPRSNGAGHPAAQLQLLGHRAPRGRRQRPYGLFDW